ncbi:MAG: hypothetical protein K2F82_01875 [Muribaculaceae bacterium]|nr:hypothetical protein [Muribaculaceae bacterium]
MYKVIFSLFLALTALLLMSGHSGAYTGGNGSVPLRRVSLPEVINHDAGTLVVDRIAPGQNLALTLWSSDDAASRVANAMMAAKARRDPGLTHIGVNVDESPAMFHEILRRDRLDSDSLQLHVSPDEAARLISGMGGGYRTVFRERDVAKK